MIAGKAITQFCQSFLIDKLCLIYTFYFCKLSFNLNLKPYSYVLTFDKQANMSNLYLHHNNNNDMNDEEKISLLSAVNDLDSDVEIRQSVSTNLIHPCLLLSIV